MPAIAATTAPLESVLRSVLGVPVIAKLVVVAKAKSELPRSVVEPRMLEATELKAPLMVDEPVTASADEVAPPVTESLRAVARPVLDTVKKFDCVLPVEAVDDDIEKSVEFEFPY